MSEYISLEGTWQVRLSDGTEGEMKLPGTLDENGLGHKDRGTNRCHPAEEPVDGGDFGGDAPIATRFTRKYTYEGEAGLSRRISLNLSPGKRIFLEAERARVLRLLADGREIPARRPAGLSSPRVFEITSAVCSGKGEEPALPSEAGAGTEHELTLLSDNSYPGLPREAIVYSSAATDETQTNWNGVLGYLRLRIEEPVFLSGVSVYPGRKSLKVRVEIDADRAFRGLLRLESECLREPVDMPVEGSAGISEVVVPDLPFAENVRLWDEEKGNLYELKAALKAAGEVCMEDCRTVTFGVRTFGDNGQGRLALNGRTIFLRSEANCAVFPETGYPPVTVEAWEEILRRYRAYGVNCMRFHSHCPPEAAFTAADRLGMLMQPELSHWNPRDAFESEESFACYREELEGILRMLANHPSFVMLTFGNELHAGEKGHERMNLLLAHARAIDGTRLYANASNAHYGNAGCDRESDFYTATGCREADLRGTFAGMKGYLNQEYPGAGHQYDESMQRIREEYKKPVFSFEVGQFEVLPDFDELEKFRGVTLPVNLELIRDRVRERGLEDVWRQYVEATGELALLCYREEVEAALRTREMSGISLLGLQDFPGQGTALVGMLNSHLEPKPYGFARPERFRAFFRESLPLVLLKKYTYEAGETLQADIIVANFGKEDVEGSVRYALQAHGKDFGRRGCLGEARCPRGAHTKAGTLEIPLDFVEEAVRFDLTVTVGSLGNTYPIWVYPAVRPVCPAGVYEARRLDGKAVQVLAEGGAVYLSPDSDRESLPRSIQAQFSTDFWSVGTFGSQEGGMGQLIDAGHPIFRKFPTEFHTNWQWWIFAGQRAVILPKTMKNIVTEMDSYAYLRPMAQLTEFRCGGGRVLFSSLGLQNLQGYPEARALLDAVYSYLSSEEFAPEQELTPAEVEAMAV